MLMTIEQIKAARALLKWTQADLATHAGLSDDQIRSFEAERTRSLDVLEAIYKTLLKHGLSVVEGGVIKKETYSYTLNNFLEVLDDICQTLPEGGEALYHCCDDRRSPPEILKKLDEMEREGYTERNTISEDNSFITGKKENYRKIPVDYFGKHQNVVVIYDNKVSLPVDGKSLVIVNKDLSKMFKEQFEYWWSVGTVI